MNLETTVLKLDRLLKHYFARVGGKPKVVRVELASFKVAKSFQSNLVSTMSGFRRVLPDYDGKPLPSMFADLRHALDDLTSIASTIPGASPQVAEFLDIRWLDQIREEGEEWCATRVSPEETYDLTLVLKGYKSEWIGPLHELMSSAAVDHIAMFDDEGVTIGGRKVSVANGDLLAVLRAIYDGRPNFVSSKAIIRKLPHLCTRIDRILGCTRRVKFQRVPRDLRKHLRSETGKGYCWVDISTSSTRP